MDIIETECDYVNWIYMTQDRVQYWALVNTVIELPGFIKGVDFFDYLSDYKIRKLCTF
jgi:hypothetical protein